ncbi:MAG: hypothetical protein EPO26_09710 [Chloroflexota bacterium]|nr:MAG: hypothetical protein EPO26_09710 [Chloroflexota bacterium]
MCTMISLTTQIEGTGKGPSGWFPVSQANVGFDHPFNAPYDHAILLDFVNPGLGPSARVAVEMSLDSGRALLERLRAAIDEAERTGL